MFRIRRTAVVNALLFVGGATADFASLSIFRSLLLSDLCIIAAGGLALRTPWRQVPQSALAILRSNWRFIAVVSTALAYLFGTGLSTALAGAPAEAVDSWLLFAMLILFLAPAVAVAVYRVDRAMVWLVRGILIGTLFGALGFIEDAIAGAPLYGLRPEGALGSDPFFVIIVGSAILATRVSVGVARRSPWVALRNPAVLTDLALLTACAVGLAVARFRSAWLAFVVSVLLAAYLAAGRLRASLFAGAVIAGVLALTYALALVPAGISDRVSGSFSSRAPDVIARSEVFELLLPVWLEHPWGIGLNQSSKYLPAALVLGAVGYIHNVVANALVEGGPLAALGIGLLPVALVVLWLGERRAAGSPKSWETTWPVVAVISVFVVAQFLPTLYAHAAWIAVGALVGVAARWAYGDRQSGQATYAAYPGFRSTPMESAR